MLNFFARGRWWVLVALWYATPATAFDSRPANLTAPIAATGTVEVLFSPWQDVEPRITQLIAAARREIYVHAFIFTSRSISNALLDAHRNGIKVQVLADMEMNGRSERGVLGVLAGAGVPVSLETRYASAHNKVMLFDPLDPDGVVLTGSYNFTYSARMKNAENVLLLRGNPLLAARYLDNWRRHRLDAVSWADRHLHPERAEKSK